MWDRMGLDGTKLLELFYEGEERMVIEKNRILPINNREVGEWKRDKEKNGAFFSIARKCVDVWGEVGRGR